MARDKREVQGLDRELVNLPPELRWREWMRRIEAVLFASATPVARDDLARVVGQGAAVDLLLEDLAAELESRPYIVARIGAGWMLQTKPAYAPAIRAAADVGGQTLDLNDFDLAVLAAIAYHQPISRDGFKGYFWEGDQPRPDRTAGRSRHDRHRPPRTPPRRALYLCHHRDLPRSLWDGIPARSARPGGTGGRGAG